MIDKVSVIIPFYTTNSVNLDIVIESVLNQTHQNLEIIIVDDQSPYPAESCISRFIESDKLKIVMNIDNKGGGISRNVGVENASGQYIAFLDHDDVWKPNKIKTQLEVYKNTFAKNFDRNVVVYSKCHVIDAGSRYTVPRIGKLETESVAEYLFCNKGLIQTSGIFLSRELALLCPFDDLKRHQDYQFCFSLEKCGAQFIMVDKPLYEFVQHPKKNDYLFSLWWLSKYNCYFSSASCLDFKKKVIIRSMVYHHGHLLKALKYSIENKVVIYTLICMIKYPLRKILRRN